MHDRFLSWPEVQATTSVSRTSAWRWEAQERFPARRRIGPNRVAWLESEVQAFLASRPAVLPRGSK